MSVSPGLAHAHAERPHRLTSKSHCIDASLALGFLLLMAMFRIERSTSAGATAYSVFRLCIANARGLSFESPNFSMTRGSVRAASLARYLGSWRDMRVKR